MVDLNYDPTRKIDLSTSDTTGKATSDYLGYGSFSGADIKVVVHVPKSLIVQKNLQLRKNNLINEAAKETRRNTSLNSVDQIPYSYNFEGESFNIDSTDELMQLRRESDENLLVINSQLEKTETDVKNFDTAPTTITLGEVQTVSWSTFREKSPVRTLGSVYPRAITRGHRTIAGSMVFTLFHKHALHELLELNFGHYSTGTSDYDKQQYTSMLIDQLPPLDISFIMANEYGVISGMGIYGIDFIQEGGTFSIEDIFSESVVQYMARDLDPLNVIQTSIRVNNQLTNEWTKTASQLMAEEDTLYGHVKRRNPFI